MNSQYFLEFALLCESVTLPKDSPSNLLLEVSSIMSSPIGKNPGGSALVKYLHDKIKVPLAHDQEYRMVRPSEITWSTLKNSASWEWVFFTGDRGTAAIRTGTAKSTYSVVIFTAEDSELTQPKPENKMNFSKSTEMLQFIKSNIGKITGIYYGTDPASRGAKAVSRDAYKAYKKDPGLNTDEIMKKFRPLLQKSVVAALANVKGHAMDSLKNDSMDQAFSYIQRAKSLREILDNLEYYGDEYAPGEDIRLKTALNGAIMMTAAHYYPNEVGNIHRRTHYRSEPSYGGVSGEVMMKLFKDISSGDREKLGTILYYFKRELATS